MKQIIITPDYLLEFMDELSYNLFINNLRIKNKIPEDEPLWIIAEFSKGEK